MKSHQIFIFLILFSKLFNSKLLGDEEDAYKFAIELKETFDEKNLIKDEGEVKFDDSISAREIVEEMGFGRNLGNTLDAWSGDKLDQGLDSETICGCTKTTEDIIKGLVPKE